MSLLPSAILMVLLALSVATSASASSWKGFLCPKNCTHCSYSFDFDSCFKSAGRYQNKNFTAISLDAIVSDTSKGFNFTILFYNDVSCSQPEQVVALTPGCPPDTCCDTDTVSLGELEFQAFTVIDWPWSPSSSPSPSAKPCDDSDNEKPPLWTIIVMAGLGGVSALLLVIVLGLMYCLIRRGQYETLN